MPFVGRLVPRNVKGVNVRQVTQIFRLNISRDVDEHRARTAGRGDVKRFLHHPRNILRIFNQVRVLDKGQGRAENICFLERVRPDQIAVDLSGDRDDRDRIQIRRRDARDQIRRPRAGRRQTHADLSRFSGVTAGVMRRSLFVANQYMFNF